MAERTLRDDFATSVMNGFICNGAMQRVMEEFGCSIEVAYDELARHSMIAANAMMCARLQIPAEGAEK